MRSLGLLLHLVDTLQVLSRRELAVHEHALVHRRHVLLGQEVVGRQVDAHARRLHAGIVVAARLGHGLSQHLRKQVKAHTRQVAVLLGAHERTGTADLQVAHGDAHAAAQVLELGKRGQARRCLLGERQLAREHKVRIGLRGRTAHAALKLVELCQTQTLRVLDDERVGGRVIDAALHDGRGDEHVDLFGRELDHHVLDLARAHLAVCHTHARLGRGLVHARHSIIDGLDAVGHVVHLAAAAHLQANRRAHHVGVVLPHVHDHGTAPGRRCGDQAHVAHTARGHLHGSRNRRCREREHVDLLAQVFELLLVLHAKALFLVDDHQAQVLGVHIGRKQAVRADEHVNRALGKRLERALLLRRGAEAAEHLDLEAKRGKALKECLVVLLGQNGRGAEHHDLAAGVHALKGRAQGDLGLAETHVTAQQAVHGLGRLHVGLDVGDGLQLVARLVVGEALLHLDLLGRIGRTGDTGNRRAARIQVDQVKRQLFGILARLVGSPRPVGGVEPGQARFIAVGTNVARNAVNLLQRHIELVAVGVFQQKVVAFLAAHFLARNLAKERDAVGSVHHVVTRLKREGDLRNVNLAAAARAVGIHTGVEVGNREHGQIGVGHHHALRQGSVHKGHAPARDGGHGGTGGSLRSARLERAGVERVGLTLANGSMGLLACGTVGGIRRCHAHAVADSAGIFGRRGQRFLKGNALVAKGELHRLARAAVGDGKHAGIALAHDLLDARHKTVVRACDGRLLNLELGRHRTAGTDEAHIVQALLGTKIELLGAHVQTVQAVNPCLAGTGLDILVGAQTVVKQRARLGQHHERLAAHVRQRAYGLAVHHRQKAVELGRDNACIHHLEQRRQLAVVLAGAVERHMHVVDGLVGKRQLTAREDLDAVLVADGLAR